MFSSSRTTFGQSAISSPFESKSVFGQSSNSSNHNPFASGSYGTAAPFGSSTGAPDIFAGNSTVFSQSACSSQSGSQSVFGQTNNSSIPSPFAPGAFGRTTSFVPKTWPNMSSGESTVLFGANSSSFPAFGGSVSSTAAPSFSAFGSSASATTAAPFSAFRSSASSTTGPSFSTFGTPSLSSTALSQSSPTSVSQSIFGEASNSGINNPVASKPLIATPFDSFTGGSTFTGNWSGSFGVTSSALASKPVFGVPSSPAFEGSTTRTGASVFNKNPGSFFQQSQSTSANLGFSSSTQSSFGSSGALVSGTSPSVFSSGAPFGSGGASGVSTTPIFPSQSNYSFAATNKHEPFSSRSIFDQPSSQFGRNSVLGTTVLESKKFPSASQTTTSTIRSMNFRQSGINGHSRGSRIASYVATGEVLNKGSTQPAGELVSISAMPTYRDKSHEELRFEDSQYKDWTGFSTSNARALASSSPISISTTSSEKAPGYSFDLSGNKPLSFPQYQFSEPSVRKTNASFGPNLFTLHSQPQTPTVISTGTGLWGNIISSTPSLVPTSNSAGFTWTKPDPITTSQKTQTAPATDAFPANISEQSLAGLNAGTFHQRTDMQQSESRSTMVVKPSSADSPFGMESRIQISVGCPISATSVQYGISCIPVSDKPAPVKRSSLLTVRHVSLGRNRPPVEKYKPKSDSNKVPFYEDKLPGIYKVGTSFLPRENTRAWVLNPMVEQPLETNARNSSLLDEKSIAISETGNSDENSEGKVRSRSSEVSTPYEVDADVEARMPKLQSPDYYVKPSIQELAAKERAEPGFCFHVKDFVVGRQGYGSIKFLGETDVRNLDLESLVQFNYREVIVYMDESKKPQVGQGLNKPAEVTLLNVKCIDKNTGKEYMDGSKVDKYRKMLIKKAVEQDAEFVSYDPVIGEWKFRVQHF